MQTFLRGPLTTLEPARIPDSLVGRHGLLFVDGDGRLILELYPDQREFFYELLMRNPAVEILRALHKSWMGSLFRTLQGFSRHPDRARFIAGLTFGYDPSARTLRIREAGRDFAAEGGSAAIQRLMHVEAPRIARALGAERMVAETFPAYGRQLEQHGWIRDASGRSWIVRLGARVNRTHCYLRRL